MQQASPLTVKVNNTCRRGGVNNTLDIVIGKATVPDTNVPAKLSVTFGDSPAAPYWVIGVGAVTNGSYEWALIYSCQSVLFVDFEGLWLVARDPLFATKEPEKTKYALDMLQQKTGYDVSRMHKTVQQGCVF